jgi:hypothetical protein
VLPQNSRRAAVGRDRGLIRRPPEHGRRALSALLASPIRFARSRSPGEPVFAEPVRAADLAPFVHALADLVIADMGEPPSRANGACGVVVAPARAVVVLLRQRTELS